MSTFFKKASAAADVGVMIFFTTYVPYYVLGNNFDSLNYAVKWFFCLPINTALGQGISIVLNMELNQKGINFGNLFTHYEGIGFSFGEVLICMLIASAIHLLLMTYIELVFPGDVGISKPWYFPFMCFKSIKNRDKNKTISNESHFDSNVINMSDFEEEPKHLQPKVRIQNLSKSFGSFKAVDNLSLNMYKDQIFVLLGPNGAGKTTTMSMLIGMIPPSSGTAFVNDYDIRTDITEARKSLGICPQHNILFNDLTVREHIIFFCRLKGMKNGKKIEMEVDKYLSIMNFEEKRNARCKTLSGGQKRKLSIANALCGNSSFVVLDEPTSGLDVTARRSLWDLLIEEKKERTILLSTHYMDEADILGDRIAIMNNGVLKTVGTSYFLKKKFGSGYRLIVVKKPQCNPEEILKILQEYAPDVSIESDEQAEVTFILSEEYLDMFSEIFKHLEEHADSLGIDSFGCSITTLEEVFLKVGLIDDATANNSNKHQETSIKFDNFTSTSRSSKFEHILNQFYAMFLKKIHFTRRNYSLLIVYGLLSAWLIFVFLAAPSQFDVSSSTQLQLNSLIHTKNSSAEIVAAYKLLFDESNYLVIDEDIHSFIFGNFYKRNQKYEIGVSLDNQPVNIYYNSYSPLSFFFALNYFHRAVLKQVAGMDFDINLRFNYYKREVTTDEPINEIDEPSQWEEISIYFLFFFMLSYWSSIHISLKIKERVTKSKLIQFISGVNRFIFTFASFIIDVTILLTTMLILLGIVVATGRPGFSTADDVLIHISIFSCYTINIIPLFYLMSFWFEKQSTGEMLASIVPFICKYNNFSYI